VAVELPEFNLLRSTAGQSFAAVLGLHRLHGKLQLGSRSMWEQDDVNTIQVKPHHCELRTKAARNFSFCFEPSFFEHPRIFGVPVSSLTRVVATAGKEEEETKEVKKVNNACEDPFYFTSVPTKCHCATQMGHFLGS
jgi:hypothetical protein